MEALGRYPLSVVLSFLNENDGTSLLICRKMWARMLLPIFRLPEDQPCIIKQTNRVSQQIHCSKHRHRYIVVLVQDASVRLERLNTRRWKQQLRRGVTFSELGSNANYSSLLRFYSSFTLPHSRVFRSGTTLLVSYPRSGNTLLRSLLESVTGVVTGSDTRPDRTLSLALANRHDLVGEGVIHPSKTPIVKTHWPERIGYKPYKAHRAILLVRNPFDAIDSYWNLNVTNTHTEKVVDAVYQDHADFFFQLALNEMKVWLDFITFWSDQDEVPVQWVRYEDFLLSPQQSLMRILQFTTFQDAKYWRTKVEHALESRHSHGYQGTSASDANGVSSHFGRSLSRYSSTLLNHMHKLDQNGVLERLGYNVYHQHFPNNVGQLPEIPVTITCKKGNQMHIKVNERSVDLRPRNCPYGRDMRTWRQKHTMDDTQPFLTVASFKTGTRKSSSK